MPSSTSVLRVSLSADLYAKVSEFPHAGRFETRKQCMLALLAAGLVALSKPALAAPPTQPAAPTAKRLIPFAGANGTAGQ